MPCLPGTLAPDALVGLVAEVSSGVKAEVEPSIVAQGDPDEVPDLIRGGVWAA